ncbi:MAG: sn-glycerol-3-phosphate ABC transporter ATP-binding protein UgpC [Thermoplasmata archaeon]|nr:sn-glycerol-3-phosphate ABC transporter ATP-binding protein UgpC [Thermoplasmata archaeon]
MAEVVLDHVCKKYGNFVAVDDFNLAIPDGEFCVLVGPSGCGKTTVLRMIAGLEDVTGGKIYLGGKVINDLPPKDRDIAMVFQSYALYPHLNVYDNIAFPLKIRKLPKREIEERVLRAAKILGITEQLEKKPAELSGGQRQRVAMGRAIVREPKVFLFDEPLSNLDAKMRVQMRVELAKLHKMLGTTMIYVTHDQTEAMTLGEKVVVMNKGRIMQFGKPDKLYDKPMNLFTAGFIGSPPMNFLTCRLVQKTDGVYLERENFSLRLPDGAEKVIGNFAGVDVVMGIRAEDIYDKLFAVGATPSNTFRVKVDVRETIGSDVFIYFTIAGTNFVARVMPKSKAESGQEIEVVFDTQKLHIFDKRTGERLW